MNETKAGARNAAKDKARIRNIRSNAEQIHALSLELDPDEEPEQAKSTRVEIKSMTDTSVTVAGYGVVFGGADLEGETFGPDTDYMLDLAPRKLVLYDHALGEVRHVIGKTASVEADEYGLFVEAELERNQRYVEQIVRLAEKGALGWSSGSVGHLVQREGKSIKRWPVVEFSLTPTPAEPRTLGVEVLKALAETDDAFKALLPQESQETLDADANETAEEATDNVRLDSVEGTDMSEEIKAVDEPQAIDYDMLADKLAAKMAPPIKTPGVVVVEDEADRALKGNPFRSFGEFLMAVKDTQHGVYDKRLRPLKSGDPMDEHGYNIAGALGADFVGSLTAVKSIKAAPTDIGESLPQMGGILVGSDRQTSILSRVYDSAQLLSRVAMDPVGPNSNGMLYYAEAETSRATGSRRGGVRFYWTAENSATTTAGPTFREMELKLKKASAAVYVTEEQLADTSNLESYIMRIMPEEIRFGVEDSILNGTGAGQPLGILNAPATIEVAKEVGQAADTIVAENVIKMWGSLWARSAPNAVWITNQNTFPQLYTMALAIGMGGVAVFMPPGGLSAAPYGTIFGRPVIVHESADTLGDRGDLILADLREYQMIEKGGVSMASSIHVRFLEGESVYRFVYRVDGQPAWDSALTPFNGSSTVSPFVVLAERA